MMKTSLRMSVVAGLAAFLVSFGATAETTFNIGGDAEYDINSGKTTYTDNNSAGATEGSVRSNDSFTSTNEGGRIQIKATARINNDWGSFVEAVAAPRFSFNSGTNTDAGDQYIKFGKKAWDIQLGRFEGVDLFPTGKDAGLQRASEVEPGAAYVNTLYNDLNDADPKAGGLGYQANKARGRDGSNRIQGAAHFNVGKTKVELGAAYRDNDGEKTTGIRPVVKFDAGRFRLGAGYDMLSVKTAAGSTDKTEGFGVTAGTTFGTVKADLNYAQGKRKIDGNTQNGKMQSIGLVAERGRFGGGYIHDKTKNVGKQDSLYVGYTVPLMGSKAARVTFAAGTSKAKYDNGDQAKNNNLKVRFNYDF